MVGNTFAFPFFYQPQFRFSMKFVYQVIVVILLFAIAYSTQAQVSGRVSSENSLSLEGVHILNQTSKSHAHSDQKGYFEIENTHKGDILLITHVGFLPQLVQIQSSRSLNIYLQEKVFDLEEVYVSPRVDAINVLADFNIKTNPVNTSQEILRQVPGLFIGQHAGGGKAEQIFLRGFDIDHGTDISISVDGMPVNMVSHAHGQGYADLHFVIPETINQLNFGKGPYYANQGNLATAGYVELKTIDALTENQVKLEVGQFNSQRVLGMFQLVNGEKHKAYIASEYQLTDGPFDSPQNFNRLNIMAKYSGQTSSSDHLKVIGSIFSSQWDASGQVPKRAIDNGSIGRFGAIDDTEGGQTSRANFSVEHTKIISPSRFLTSNLYYSNYQFELYSNFTFFLDDPINGDQIRQKENRDLFGLSSEYNQSIHLGLFDGSFTIGAGLRSDIVNNNELSHTKNRTIVLDSIQFGDIHEINAFSYANMSLESGKWVINPGFRFDRFDFNYTDALKPYQTQQTLKSIISPKLNILYNLSNQLQLYVKSGKGFHSNDTRLITGNINKNILPAAWGTDLGFISKPTQNLLINTAIWYLYSEQEFVYVGDAGIVEPSGRSRRMGVDLSFRHQPSNWLFWNFDINYTVARAIDEPEDQNYIPLAPDLTAVSGISIIHPSGIYGGIRMRHINDRPANEDNSIIAKGYTVIDGNIGHQWNHLDLSVNVQNLFDVEWNETQFATESRLKDELNAVEEIHFTPGTPFFLKGSLTYKF